MVPAATGSRTIPRPLAGHPGNIFLAGEAVRIAVPPGESENWMAVDYEGRVVAQGRGREGTIELGKLAVGYYEVLRVAAKGTNRVSLGVLPPLRAPTPRTSPIGIDVAMSWFYTRDRMPSIANLCALAGMNRVRDRLAWSEMEPRRAAYAGTNRYDVAAQVQSDAGLQVLQLDHCSPEWANPNTKRFPLDLRDVYNYHREIARRWRGEVGAFEPWNEGDIPAFGGHTGSEMASLQKAAFLGLKAGNPKVTACWNVFALHRASTLRDVDDNEAWPYFDTFNLHHYEALDCYPRLYADFRGISAGRPLWVTECSVPVKWCGDERLQEPSPADLRAQGERVAKVYSATIHEGANAVFYFILPHFVEGETQFGVLRPDLTPRPAYLALAAAGRLLADARPLGRLQTARDSIHGFVFAAKPDGKRQNVLVVWSDKETSFDVPGACRACFDHLGRAMAPDGDRLTLTSAPVFVLFPPSVGLPVLPPPQNPPYRPGKPSTVVLQALVADANVLVEESAYKLAAGEEASIQLFAYNFGKRKAAGRMTLGLPTGWTAECLSELEVQPGERKAIILRVKPCGAQGPDEAKVRVSGDFGRAGEAVLSLRFVVAKP